MHLSVEKLNIVRSKIKEIISKKQLKTDPNIIAITKTFSIDKIMPLIEFGHLHFGENKIQEAEDKWLTIKNQFKNLKLHMVGKLQSNKAKKAVKFFDYIHSLDNPKLATKLCQYEKELNKKVKIFIQVNLGEESQKSGILLSDVEKFYKYCVNELSLNVIGLMCLPPMDTSPGEYFKILQDTSQKLNLPDLSMGMSSDYEEAILNGSTYLRLGTAIFGERSL
tara:strand:- start:252 stop:917 length:666 start_codon:yes stop_codon:yes gene_type:complete